MRLTRIYPTDTYLALSEIESVQPYVEKVNHGRCVEIESVQPYVEKVNHGRCVEIRMRSGAVHNLTIVHAERFAKPIVIDAQFADWMKHGPLAPILEG